MNNQKIDNIHNKELAECVGLWLAEGDNKSIREITFTNNCWDLIEFFHTCIKKVFNKHNLKIRIYVYNYTQDKITIPLRNVMIKHYVDKRATKPYYIWRLASTDLVKEWKRVVEATKKDKESFAGILRGFFAGEGNIKEVNHGSRTLRICQGKQLEWMDKILHFFGVNYHFCISRRNGYVIQKKENFDKLSQIGIADLHPLKKEKFNRMLRGYKQTHYPRGHLKSQMRESFKEKEYYTAKELALVFNRSQDRISELLTELKKEKVLKNFRVRSRDYWMLNNKGKILISGIKYKYLNILNNDPKRLKEIAEEAGVCTRAAGKRLEELRRIGLTKKDTNKKWSRIEVKDKVIVI